MRVRGETQSRGPLDPALASDLGAPGDALPVANCQRSRRSLNRRGNIFRALEIVGKPVLFPAIILAAAQVGLENVGAGTSSNPGPRRVPVFMGLETKKNNRERTLTTPRRVPVFMGLETVTSGGWKIA